jgi:hypothetical protein
VTAQLLYETGGPRYANPDVVARFDTIELAQEGPDRVRISGVRGEPAPPTMKVCLNFLGGFRNSMTFVLTGLDIEEKAALARRSLFAALGGEEQFAEVDARLVRSDKPDATSNEESTALLRVTVKDVDPNKVGRRFANAVIEMALANYPGFFCTTPPGNETPYGVYWPVFVPADLVPEVVVLDDGTRHAIEPLRHGAGEPPPLVEDPPLVRFTGPTERRPLGALIGARSGDKGGNANVGLWARDARAYEWLRTFLTIERFRALLPEARDLPIERHPLPNLLAINFVVHRLLGEGVASSTRPDPQAKGLGEFLRSRYVEIPQELL